MVWVVSAGVGSVSTVCLFWSLATFSLVASSSSIVITSISFLWVFSGDSVAGPFDLLLVFGPGLEKD